MAGSPILHLRVTQDMLDALADRAAQADQTPSETARRILARALRQKNSVPKVGRPKVSDDSAKT